MFGTVKKNPEISKIDPKCWVCGKLVIPIKVAYNPLRCKDHEKKDIDEY